MTEQLQVGIDLGTTHSVVAVAQGAHGPVRVLRIAQRVDASQVDALDLLPSALFADPGARSREEVYSWDDPTWTVGEYARRRARELPNRAIVSAKSWLCHEGVDREAAILPWARGSADGSHPGEPGLRLSPVAASAHILRHLRCQLLDTYAERLSTAQVVLAVPASFDPVARQLTLRAASEAGFQAHLIEEPQAAFYDAIGALGEVGLASFLGEAASKLVLVVDVGGGTTDLTLVRVHRRGPQVRCERVAVGRHLLLGGDNIDLALAHVAECRLGGALTAAEFGQLLLGVREAKERLLGADAPEAFPVVIAQSGASLVGGTRRVELTRAEVVELLTQGFLPDVRTAPVPISRAGLTGFGLPYERDPAITRHIAQFAQRHASEYGDVGALLFNGGLFHSPVAALRIREVLEQTLGKPLEVLTNASPDLAVARGAVAFAQALLGHGVKVESHSPRGYYVGVEGGEQPQAVCVVPRGASENTVYTAHQSLGLAVGRVSRFELYASETARHEPGTLITLDSDHFHRLPPLTTRISETSADAELVPVHLEGSLSGVGTLQLTAVENARDGLRHLLNFELRSQSSVQPDAKVISMPTAGGALATQSSTALAEALLRIDRVFGKGRSDVREREVKDLMRELERLLGARREWSLATLRAMADALLQDPRARRRSAEHERVFFWLVGYCLRPGFGHPLDEARVEQMAPLFGEGLQHSQERKHWEAFLIAWRRVAPGLKEAWQVDMRDRLDAFVAPEDQRLKKPKNFRPQGQDDILWLCTWLERVPAERRRDLGQWCLERTWSSREPVYWEMLGRIGARVPVYASAHHTVEARVVERWLEHLLSENWQAVPSAAGAALALSRVTGDRSRDLPEAVRKEVARRLTAHGSPEAWRDAVLQYVPMANSERQHSYGDDLPIGLSLI
jgi:molecular chaperone DnaK (HSP70)